MSVLLDGYPDDYNGYLIRTDFRIGLQICACLADEEFNEFERQAQALYLLYGNGIPECFEEAIQGLSWFLNGGKEINEQESNKDSEAYFDFTEDARRIETAFRRFYGIDLDSVNLHWFKFLDYIGDLGECAFTNVIEIRSKKITANMTKEEVNTYRKLKEEYALKAKKTISPKEQEATEEFLKYIKNK